MTETKEKDKLCKRWRDRWKPTGDIVLRHENRFGKGMPDISLTAFGHTMWIEGKVWGKSKLKPTAADMRSVQHLRMREFAKAGCAYYVIWRERYGDTLILHPSVYDLSSPEEWQHLVIPSQVPDIVIGVLRGLLAGLSSASIVDSYIWAHSRSTIEVLTNCHKQDTSL